MISRASVSMLTSLVLMVCIVAAAIFGWWATKHQWLSKEVMAGATVFAVIVFVFLVPDVVRGMRHFANEAAKEIQ